MARLLAPAYLVEYVMCLINSLQHSAVCDNTTYITSGESTKSAGLRLQRKGQPITLWARDQPASSADINLYGSHPILYDVRTGMLFLYHFFFHVDCTNCLQSCPSRLTHTLCERLS